MADAQALHTTLERANARAWGIATGLVLGLSLCGATFWLVAKDGAQAGAHLGRLSQVLPGYSVSWGGGLIGLVYGFVIGYALGRLLAPRQPLTAAERSSERNKHVRLNGRTWSRTFGGLLAIALGGTTAALVIRGGEEVGPLLGRLALYLPGFSVTWSGAAFGALWAFAVGWVLGQVMALVYNASVSRAEERIAGG